MAYWHVVQRPRRVKGHIVGPLLNNVLKIHVPLLPLFFCDSALCSERLFFPPVSTLVVSLDLFAVILQMMQ